MNSDLLQDLITEQEVFFLDGDRFKQCRTVVPVAVGEESLDNDATEDLMLFHDGDRVPVSTLVPDALFICDGSSFVPLASVLV